jgi:signal transduction histidine kinase
MSSADNLDRYHDRLPAAKRTHLLHTIHKAVRRMSGMMEEVLVLGRVESGKTDFKPAAFDLHAFCRRLCDEIQTATGRRCPVEIQVEKAPSTAFGDEALLRHIVSNLLSNAIKYSPEGQPVTLRWKKEGSNGVLSVIDRGCGIPAADQARLFQAFHRGSNVRQVPGTGLGLVIVKRCVGLHGGTIDCQSTEGEGTTFRVVLPLYAGESGPNSGL